MQNEDIQFQEVAYARTEIIFKLCAGRIKRPVRPVCPYTRLRYEDTGSRGYIFCQPPVISFRVIARPAYVPLQFPYLL